MVVDRRWWWRSRSTTTAVALVYLRRGSSHAPVGLVCGAAATAAARMQGLAIESLQNQPPLQPRRATTLASLVELDLLRRDGYSLRPWRISLATLSHELLRGDALQQRLGHRLLLLLLKTNLLLLHGQVICGQQGHVKIHAYRHMRIDAPTAA